MKVLVACEYSGRVRDAFIKKGHDAISCDLLPTDVKGPHHQGDVFEMLDEDWDLIIAHPPCTYLCVAGNHCYGEGKDKYQMRLDAVVWTEDLWNACWDVSDKVCFENPVGVLPRMSNLPKPYYVQPYEFGHPEQKKTGLFTEGLPTLMPTIDAYEEMLMLPKGKREANRWVPPGPDRWKIRSLTYQGIADAMAEQWGLAHGS